MITELQYKLTHSNYGSFFVIKPAVLYVGKLNAIDIPLEAFKTSGVIVVGPCLDSESICS